MGYCISVVDTKFRIQAEDKQKALKAMKAMTGNLHWVTAADLKGFRTLEEGLECWGYWPDVDDDGNITDVSFSSEKLGAEFEMFKAIAPFVQEGSFIEVSGEDGASWRWVFKSGACKEIHADKSFDEEDEEDSVPKSLVLKVAQAVRDACEKRKYNVLDVKKFGPLSDKDLEKIISKTIQGG